MDGVTSMQETRVETSDSKRRKLDQKTIVRVRAEANAERQKGEGPPSDSWSWRKYGQKPIKGSPYPRCSTSKGCSAKKQVERCRTDASMIIITYTSDHNHPGSHLPPSINKGPPSDPACPEPEQSTATCGPGLKAPTSPLFGEAEAAHDQLGRFGGVGPIPCSNLVVASSTSKSSEDEDDFFDELEELPISSSFTGLVRSSFFDERILLPS